MFYQGSLQEGISTAVGQQKLVLCFVTNENEESQTWQHEYLQDSSLLKLIETQAVALRLIADSEEAGYLSQIFPLPKTPTVVIMKHGELKEYISAGTSKEDFLRRILVAFNAAPQVVSAAAASSSSLPSPASSPATSPTRPAAPVPAAAHASVLAPAPSTSPPPPSQAQTQSQSQTHAPPASVQAAAQSEIVNRILAERAAKLKAQKEEAERKAKEERAKAQEKAKAEAQAGANTDGAKVYQQAEELKKKRLAEQEERRRILKRIEDDKEERRMRASAKEQQKIESQKADNASSASAKLSKLPSTTRVSEMASIQVRLFDGSTIRSRFKTASPLKEVRRWVDENREGNAPYTFKQVLTPLPNKNIDATEENKALGELGLVPSSTLVLIPVQKYSSAYSAAEQQQKSFFSKFLAMILGFFTWLLSLIGLGGGQREITRERASSDATARTASEERNRRVRGLQNLQRDHQLYNGNSLNFEPRPDDDET
ncbi:hypothetical protein N5P37_003294 [Trichoderma harzianum]|uniref:UBX domain-containing protein 2 n=1 Tax=Trichoderma harzianum CBS 226.95 TaxID=983964 RepID=A0A2T4AU08_TRIHA|nr:hypothetical protein M431DRAFT_489293 [Trichoderma harzianum CBS 226.95]KAK0763904.1 hypothetical protein N5P37_003294 [Trichoderma harzianum]PKK46460.1 hypothetical protein CI102_8451 [Trichoderma harzianum]PTB60531.1 hypothetical protein M431DRAFT_489293 [Trichoderma harzianum CBS 226.95]